MMQVPFEASLPWIMYLANEALKKTEKKSSLEDLTNLPFTK